MGIWMCGVRELAIVRIDNVQSLSARSVGFWAGLAVLLFRYPCRVLICFFV